MRKKNNKPSAIVLGLTANGLSVMRNLSRHGISVIGLDNGTFKPAFFTRHAKCCKVNYDVLDNQDLWMSRLVDIGRELRNKTVLFPASDKYVVFIAKNKAALSKYFLFNIPDEKMLDLAVSKEKLYEIAVKIGIPVPKTYSINGTNGITKVSEEIRYPCIIKPAYSHIWRKYYSQKKVEIASDAGELIEKYEQIEKKYPQISLIVQDIIKGADSNVYLLMSYFNKDSEPLAVFTPRKLRQYPVDFGIGSFDISEYQPRVIELGLKLLKGLNYTGIAGIEFKKDDRDGEFKLMEINARTCLIGEIAVGSGVELPYIAYRDIIGEKVKPVYKFKEGIKWFGLEWDLFSFIEYRRRGKLTFWKWIKSLRGKKVYAYFAWDDPMPALISFIRICRRLSKSLLMRFHKSHLKLEGVPR